MIPSQGRVPALIHLNSLLIFHNLNSAISPFKDRLFFRGKLDGTSGTNLWNYLPINVKQMTLFSKFRSLIIIILLILYLYTVYNYLLEN